MDVAEIVQLVLHELEARNACAVERHVVGAAGGALGDDGRAHVVPRLQPAFEDRRRRQVFLRIDAADLAAAIVQVEVGGNLVVAGGALQLALVGAECDRQRLLGRIRGFRVAREVLFHVGLRADQALFLAGPQRDPDGAVGLGAHSFQDTHCLHHHRHARAVVVGAGTGVPGIQVRAQHHHFVALRAAAGEFGNGVVARLVDLVDKARIDVQAQPNGVLAIQRAHHGVVVLGHHDHGRHAHRLARLARTAAHDPHDAVVPAADRHAGNHALVDQELVEQRGEFRALAVLRNRIRPATAVGRQRIRQQVLQAGVVVAVEVRLLVDFVGAQLVGEQHLALQLALPLLQVFLLAQLGEHRLAFHRSFGARRPCFGQRVQRHHPRAEHLHPGVAEFPAAANVVDGLVVHFGQAPLGELGARPRVGLRHRRRVGQARADHIGEVVQRRHHLRALEGLLTDAAGHVEIDRFLGVDHAHKRDSSGQAGGQHRMFQCNFR